MKESVRKLNRRDFIRVSALAGGGMVLGFSSVLSCTSENDSSKLLDLNAFIKIDTNGQVIILNPNPEIGQGVKTALPMLIAEELDIDWTTIKVEQAGLDTQKYTKQVAGGSGSIRESWDSFRQAGATARAMLINAAAKKWAVPKEMCETEKGSVINKQNGEKLVYGDLVELATTMDVPKDVKVKSHESFKLIGKRVANVDNQAIVTGQYKYGIDTKSEGMMYATIIRAPAFGQTLQSVDDSETKKSSGVNQVLQFENKIAVIGRSTWEVFQGAKKIKATWIDDGHLASTSDYKSNMKERLMNGPADESKRKDGNIKQALAKASKVIELTFEAPFLAHNTMEPMNFFAHVSENHAALHGPIQTPERTRTRIAELLGLPEEKISIMMTRMGGGFGRRLMSDFAEEAVQVSKLAGGIPVNVIWSRESDMTGGFYRPMYYYKYQAGTDTNGKLIAWHHQSVGVGAGAANADSFPAGAVQHFQVDTQIYKSPVSTAPWRAPTHNFIAFSEQSFIDEIAHKINKDPVAFRLEILKQAETAAVGKVTYNPVRFAAVIRKAAEISAWGKPKGEHVFQGFAAHFSFETYVAEVAELVKQEDGKLKLKKIYCVADCGTVVNLSGAETQLEGGIIDGIGHAMYAELTLTNGKPDQTNFNNYRMIRMTEAPEVEVHFIQNNEKPTGLGEPDLPPAAPALANAVYAATGVRLTTQPFIKSGLFA